MDYVYGHDCRREMLPFVPADVIRVLEVGCGTGAFGAALKAARSVEVIGVESSVVAAERAAQCLDDVITADIEQDPLPLPSAYFDCLVLNDVLEHLRDPWGALQNLSAHLRPHGYAVASIPNMRHFEVMKSLLLHRDWTYTKWGVLDRTHLRFFTLRTIPTLFEQCGYRMLRLEGINGGRFPWKFGILNCLSLNALDDMRYLQFACVGQLMASPDAASTISHET